MTFKPHCIKLTHASNEGINHLDSGIMGRGKHIYDAARDSSPPPPDESVIAGGVRAKHFR
jgi:hypothetical protein